MKGKMLLALVFWLAIFISGCSHDGFKSHAKGKENVVDVLFLHHSTGGGVFKGYSTDENSQVIEWFNAYNDSSAVQMNVVEQLFPKAKRWRYFGRYGWNNYPYDYYNIWVKHGGQMSYKEEPTLKLLTQYWDVIVFKHCFPVSAIQSSTSNDIDSETKTIGNYKLQYEAIKTELRKYPETKFILWTGAALTESSTTEEQARRATEFFTWVKESWDEPGDNIYLWDFYALETEGGLYLKDEFAKSSTDSHPNSEFNARVAPLFCERIVDVVFTNGNATTLEGRLVGDEE